MCITDIFGGESTDIEYNRLSVQRTCDAECVSKSWRHHLSYRYHVRSHNSYIDHIPLSLAIETDCWLACLSTTTKHPKHGVILNIIKLLYPGKSLTSLNIGYLDFHHLAFEIPFCFVLLLPWASYQIRKIAGCTCAGNAGNVFPATD